MESPARGMNGDSDSPMAVYASDTTLQTTRKWIMSLQAPRKPPASFIRDIDGQPLRFAEVILPDHVGQYSNSPRPYADSYYWKASCEPALELAPLTKRNLTRLTKRLANRGLYEPSCSTTPWGTADEEYRSKMIRKEHGDPIPYKRSPSPCPPLDAPISRSPEKPRPVSSALATHEPHQCELGMTCLLEIDDLNYHRFLATHLIAMAREARLTRFDIESGQGYHNLEGLKYTSKYAAELLLDRRDVNEFPELNPIAIRKKIQSPEYWETESRYLQNPGCLTKRQEGSVALNPTGNFPPPPPGRIMTPKEAPRVEPLLGHPVRARPNTSLSPLLYGENHLRPNNTECGPTRKRKHVGEKKTATFPKSSNQIPDQTHVPRKRMQVKDAAAVDSFSPKRRKTAPTPSTPSTRSPNISTLYDESHSNSSHLLNPTSTQESARQHLQQPPGPAGISRTSNAKRSRDQRQTATSRDFSDNNLQKKGASTMPRSQIIHTSPSRRSARLSKTDGAARQAERGDNRTVIPGTMQQSNRKKRKLFSKDRG
ncbi:hypothetical protein GX51_02510 [Blastomyces parvus]|uniref:Uncharacterized protein n=1 Tax=Blastomyces parvus TaxID=2060905 RepID=A0A2B7XBG6_9EURO|nr:hypothetical protein GX51_02510 [Blastomyces parvus]